MKRVILLSLVFCCFAASGVFAAQVLVQLQKVTPAQKALWANAGVDIARVGPDFLEVVLDSARIPEIEKLGLPFTVVIKDLDALVARRVRSQKAGAQYFTYDTMTAQFKAWVEQFPKICRLESIGKSFEGRDIWALKVSDNPAVDEKEPAALIMGAHHSREWISVEVPMATAKSLLEGYGKDERLTKLVDERETWFVPMVNPDGVIFSMTQQKFWRKNRRKNADGTYGVDPNRNYGYKWGDVGSSNSPSADTYHGTGPFSEPETQAIRDFAKRQKFQADISFHSYSELILYPFSWGYPNEAPNPHVDLFAKFAKELAAFNKYTPQVSSDLYPSMGDTDDFMYGELKSLSFTFELARTFIPAQTEIAKINEQNVPAVLYLIEKAGSYGLVAPAGEELVPALGNDDLVAAVKDLTPFAKADDIAARLQKIQNQLALRVLAERRNGETDLRSRIQTAVAGEPVFASVLRLAGEGARFDELHGDR